MPTKAERAADKWENSIQRAAPDAVQAYDGGLATARAKYTSDAVQTKMDEQYKLSKARRKNRYTAAMTTDKAGRAYMERMTQIAANGFTDYQKLKVQNGVELREYLRSLYPAVKTLLLAGTASSPEFKPANQPAAMQDMIININVMKRIDNFTTATTAQHIYDNWKATPTGLIGIANKA